MFFYFLLFFVALIILLSTALSRLQAITLPLVEITVLVVVIGWILHLGSHLAATYWQICIWLGKLYDMCSSWRIRAV